MCLHPFMGFYTGKLTSKGNNSVVVVQEHYEPGNVFPFEYAEKRGFEIDKSRCSWRIERGRYVLTDPIPIPCGSCWQCLLDKAKTWAVRGVLESQFHKFNYFVTLTYDDAHLRFDDLGNAVLSFRDHQLFMKRLRKALGVVGLRFLGCGEYGESTGRPHLHYILFLDKPLHVTAFGVNRFHCPEIAKCWPFGLHEVSDCASGCIAYVAGYVVKKAKLPDDSYSVKPFRCMSRRPGLGRAYLDAHPDILEDLKVYGDFGNSKSRAVPRYFKSLLGDDYKRLRDDLVELARLSHDNDVAVYGKSSFEDIGFEKGAYLERDIFSKEDKL